MQSRLAVIMVTDIVGYTAMMAADEAEGIAVVHEVNDQYLEPKAEEQGGEILKRLGDGWIVAFGSVHGGIGFATELLEALSGHPKIKVRIGSHIGDIVEDGADFYGAGVNMAARLQSEAPPAGLMVSGDLYRQLTGEIAKQFESAGSFDLKNIPYPVEGFQWRPVSRKKKTQGAMGEIPTVLVENFEYAPQTPDAQAHTQELRDQILMILSRRTGVRTIDASDGTDVAPVYRLRGRFRMSGDRARMTVSMVLCETAETLFSRNYEGDASDIFEFADKITAQVSADTRVQINAYDANRSRDLDDDELSVSELRSRAANEFYKGTYESWIRARDLMDRALSLSPQDTMAIAMRAMATATLAAARYEPLDEAASQAVIDDMDAAIAAARPNDFLFTSRSQVHAIVSRDIAAAKRDAKKALDINPHYIVGHLALAMSHMLGGEFSDAIAVLEKSRELGTEDPLEPMRLFPLAVCYFCVGDYSRCAEILEDIIHKTSGFWALHKLRSMALEKLGDTEGANRCITVAERLPRVPAITTFQPPLPPEYQDLLDALRPTG